jgi:hypothetical protein
MRSDMAKVIVERPRCGSGDRADRKGYRKEFQRCAWDEQPRREGIKRRSGGTRMLNEHLGPLRRFLLSRAGQPWAAVFSEICAHINRGSAVQDHVRDHVADYVAVHVVLIDGVPCHGEGRLYGQPLHRWPGRPLLYVCPRTGILRKVEHVRRRRALRKARALVIRVDDHRQCRLIHGAWHLVEVKRFPLVPRPGTHGLLEPDPSARRHDVILKRALSAREAEEVYGEAVHAVAGYRLTRAEQRRLPIPAEWWR